MIIHCDTTRFILEVLEGGEYSYLFKDYIVLDVGCNIGAFSFWIANNSRVVHAVDLAPQNIENLNKSIKDNNISNIKTHCCAISGKNGRRWVKSSGETAGAGGWSLTDDTYGSFEADCYTLATFMDRISLPRVDILKLDVEGAELEILESPDFPYQRVSTIIGEIHGNISVENRLVNLGYQYVEAYGGHFIARR